MSRPAVAALIAMLLAHPAAASRKPCRDAAGRIIECKTPRKPMTRCKDAAGRFIPCPASRPERADGADHD